MAIKLTENLLRSIIYEACSKVLNEHTTIVNQLDNAEAIIRKQWTGPDDMWWIKIDQRFKDFRHYNKRHPQTTRMWARVNGKDHMDGTPRENHVGYVIVRGRTVDDAIASLKNACVHLHPWAARQYGTNLVKSQGNIEAIKEVCNLFYARAYMTINKRSISDVVSISKSDKANNMDFDKHREFHHRAGQPKHGISSSGRDWEAERPWTLVDCDIDDAQGQKELEDLMSKNGITPFASGLSHDGKHYITDNPKIKNLDFSPVFSKYPTLNRPGDPPILAKGDASLLLYSPCGI